MTWGLLWPTVSFRPLSGNRGYRSVSAATGMSSWATPSFRPLSGNRGYRSVSAATGMSSWATPSFRPLSGKWGYRYVHRSGQAGVQPPHVSVPSRGNGVIDSIGFLESGRQRFPAPVSVPSRGNGVIDSWVCNWTIFPKLQSCFRPLSGKWGIDSRSASGMTRTRSVSVPSRGNGVIDQEVKK